MAARLLSRERFIPHGFQYFQPEINFVAPKNVSFHNVVMATIAARRGNPAKLKRYNWSLDYNTVANEVDEFNAKICQVHGWDSYITVPQNPSLPKVKPPNQAKALESLRAAAVTARNLVAGAKTLVEFLDSGEAPVAPALSEHRAIVCSACPKNEPGDFTRWFTTPAAELIKRQVERTQSLKLSTPRDAQLNLCTACHCPLKLKVHVPIEWITKRLSPEQMNKLKEAPGCWILSEAARQ